MGPAHTAAPEAAQAAVDAPTASVMLVRLGGARWGIAPAALAEVIALPPLTRLPGAPDWVGGVVNWRGRILAAVDLRPLLGLDVPALPSSARILVLTVGPVSVGLLAEAVTGVAELTTVLALPPSAAAQVRAMTYGQIIDSHGPVALLDADAVVGLAARLRTDGSRAVAAG